VGKTKYKEYFKKMLKNHEEEFNEFRELHRKYSLDQDKWQNEFNEKGKTILEIAREWENRLCKNTERGMYSKYSTKLADKFQDELRKEFNQIDRVGIIAETKFTINKIDLS
jgi:hypothetical protein